MSTFGAILVYIFPHLENVGWNSSKYGYFLRNLQCLHVASRQDVNENNASIPIAQNNNNTINNNNWKILPPSYGTYTVSQKEIQWQYLTNPELLHSIKSADLGKIWEKVYQQNNWHGSRSFWKLVQKNI